MSSRVMMLLAGAGVLVSCGDSTGPIDSPDPVLGPAVTASVGAAGGTIQVILGDDSRLTLLIPPGALVSPLSITVTPKLPSAGNLGSAAISPGNILFLKPVTLTVTLGSPQAAGVAQHATLAMGTASKPRTLFLPTTPSGTAGLSFTAMTPIFGSPTGPGAQLVTPASATAADSLAAVPLAGTHGHAWAVADEQAQVDLTLATIEAQTAAMLAAVAALEATDSYPQAITLRLAVAGLAQGWGFEEVAQQALQDAAAAACLRLSTRVAVASGGLGADFKTLWTLLRPMLAWAAASHYVGLEPTDCAPLGQLNAVMSTLISQFVGLYTQAMEGPTFKQQAPAVAIELYRALEVRPWGELLDLDAEFAVVKSQIQLPLAERYRKASYAWCRSDYDQKYLGVLFRAARDGRMANPATDTLTQSVSPEDDFGFTADNLSDDINYCGTSIVVRRVSTAGFGTNFGPVGGGAEPGTVTREANILAELHGSIELDSLLVAFRCENDAFGDDRILVDFNGTRIRELQRVGVTAHFIRPDPRVFTVDSLASLGGVNQDQGGTFPLTIRRESNGCGGEFLQAGEGSTRLLATINLEYPRVGVAIAPATASLQPGTSQQFVATVTGTNNTAVTWTVTGGNSSIAGNTLTYTAGNVEGAFAVTARSVADTARVATATVEIGGSCPATGGPAAFVSASTAAACEGPIRNLRINRMHRRVFIRQPFPDPECDKDSQLTLNAPVPPAQTFPAVTCTFNTQPFNTGQASTTASESYSLQAQAGQPITLTLTGTTNANVTADGSGSANARGEAEFIVAFDIVGASVSFDLTGSLASSRSIQNPVSNGINYGDAGAYLNFSISGDVDIDQNVGLLGSPCTNSPNCLLSNPATATLSRSGLLPPGSHSFSLYARSSAYEWTGGGTFVGSASFTITLRLTP